jgi:hypothetical protein
MERVYTIITNKKDSNNYGVYKPLLVKGKDEIEITNKLNDTIMKNIYPQAKRIRLNVGKKTRFIHSGITTMAIETKLFNIQSLMGLDIATIFNQ